MKNENVIEKDDKNYSMRYQIQSENRYKTLINKLSNNLFIDKKKDNKI